MTNGLIGATWIFATIAIVMAVRLVMPQFGGDVSSAQKALYLTFVTSPYWTWGFLAWITSYRFGFSIISFFGGIIVSGIGIWIMAATIADDFYGVGAIVLAICQNFGLCIFVVFPCGLIFLNDLENPE